MNSLCLDYGYIGSTGQFLLLRWNVWVLPVPALCAAGCTGCFPFCSHPLSCCAIYLNMFIFKLIIDHHHLGRTSSYQEIFTLSADLWLENPSCLKVWLVCNLSVCALIVFVSPLPSGSLTAVCYCHAQPAPQSPGLFPTPDLEIILSTLLPGQWNPSPLPCLIITFCWALIYIIVCTTTFTMTWINLHLCVCVCKQDPNAVSIIVSIRYI